MEQATVIKKKIGEHVGEKVTAMKEIVEQKVDKAAAAVAAVGSESSSLIDKITKRLKSIESQLQRLKFGSVKRSDGEEFIDDDDDQDDLDELRAIGDDQSRADKSKKFRSLGLDAELRGNLKSSISDAVKGAQEKFNKLIDDQVAKINAKIVVVTSKFESAFDKIQDALRKLPPAAVSVKPTERPATTAKVYTPPSYKPTTTMPSTTARPSPPTRNPGTTPEYYKYTDEYYFKAVQSLNRMDANVATLEIAESSEKPETAITGDAVKADNDEVEEASSEAEALDDLQSRVVDTVKDALKSDEGDSTTTIGNNKSETLENPEDKSKADIEATLNEELRKELAESAKTFEEESATTSQPLGESVKSLEGINSEADAAIDDDDEMRSFDSAEDDDENPIESVADVDEGNE